MRSLEGLRPCLDLRGPDGNAFMLLGHARRFATQLGWDADAIAREMHAGDYRHLVATFRKYFAEYVDVIGDDPDLDD